MASQQGRKERASSDRIQAEQAPILKRPSLPNRTNSAPVGALHQMTTTKVAPSTSHHQVGQQTVIEEDQSSTTTKDTTDTTDTMATTATTATTARTTSSGNPAMPPRVGDEVCFCLMDIMDYGSTLR